MGLMQRAGLALLIPFNASVQPTVQEELPARQREGLIFISFASFWTTTKLWPHVTGENLGKFCEEGSEIVAK